MFFITESDEYPNGYVVLSTASQWENWLRRNIPGTLDNEVQRRLTSNLKHIIVGLEMKAALINPHAQRGGNEHSLLFESYFQNLIQEFCVGAFSVLEGLGSAHWLHQNGQDGAVAPRISRDNWRPALCSAYDADGEYDLNNAIERTTAVRDLLHQDRLGARENIDWHAFSYDEAFLPASSAISTLLRCDSEHVPETTNLNK